MELIIPLEDHIHTALHYPSGRVISSRSSHYQTTTVARCGRDIRITVNGKNQGTHSQGEDLPVLFTAKRADLVALAKAVIAIDAAWDSDAERTRQEYHLRRELRELQQENESLTQLLDERTSTDATTTTTAAPNKLMLALRVAGGAL